GLYGKTTLPIDPEVQKKALIGYPKGEKPITCRPGDVIEPAMQKLDEELKGLAKDLDDKLIVAIYNLTGKKFLKIKYGLEPMPEDMKPVTMEAVKAEQELIAKAKTGTLVEKAGKEAPAKPEGIRQFDVFVDDEYFLVEVNEKGGAPRVISRAPIAAKPVANAAPAATPAPAPAKTEAPKPAPVAVAPVAAEGTSISAPMPGMLVRYEKQIGDSIKVGETILVLEAMKMYNNIPSPVQGKVVALPLNAGDIVSKGQVLATIKPV
ncbi:MAG: biotin/lipoyl-containing protein, partial [Candidatus Cloacimonadaceae bacterium]|nr:biotin/lipoyl-containing protein [Candidatus Cloacimonadaceae bacterium]